MYSYEDRIKVVELSAMFGAPCFFSVSAELFGFLLANSCLLYNKFPNEVKILNGTSQNAKTKSCETITTRINRV